MLKNLRVRHDQQLTDRHQELKSVLAGRIEHLARLIAKLKERQASAKKQTEANPEARLYVAHLLTRSTQLDLCGHNLVLGSDLIGVIVHAKPVHGSHVSPLPALSEAALSR
ncbi:hypothetical protein ACXYUI_26695, partial [Klebsiella pneumoniae]